jgi:hypothetical protein
MEAVVLRVPTSDIFDVSLFRDGVIAEGFTEINCWMKHFVEGREVERRTGALSLSGRNISARDLNVQHLDRKGGMVQFLWTLNIRMAFTPVGMVTGDGELPLTIEYSAADDRGRVTFRPLGRTAARPRTRGIAQVSFDVDACEGDTSGTRSMFRSAFDINFAIASTSPGVSASEGIFSVSGGSSGSNRNSSLRCSARAVGSL